MLNKIPHPRKCLCAFPPGLPGRVVTGRIDMSTHETKATVIRSVMQYASTVAHTH